MTRSRNTPARSPQACLVCGAAPISQGQRLGFAVSQQWVGVHLVNGGISPAGKDVRHACSLSMKGPVRPLQLILRIGNAVTLQPMVSSSLH